MAPIVHGWRRAALAGGHPPRMAHIAEGFSGIITTAGPAVIGRPTWVDEFVRRSDWSARGLEGELRAFVRAGELTPVVRGVLRWRNATTSAIARGEHPDDDRFRALTRAAGLVAPVGNVISHESAAMLHGARTLSRWPDRPILTVPQGCSAHSSGRTARHSHALAEIDRVDGLPVTTPARTLADVARTAPRRTAFELLCSGLFSPRDGSPLTTPAEVGAELDLLGAARGVRAARALLRLATDGCESPAEARSLLLILDLGFSPPRQQVVFRDREGPMVVDFFWPEAHLVGECDGVAKYLTRDAGDGRSAARAVVDEKLREDRLRALGLGVVRWTPTTLRDTGAFAHLLERAGAPR